MTRRIALALLLFLGLFAPARAQENVVVFSGEHDGFTRLVFEVDPNYRHEIKMSPGMIRIAFPDNELNFGLARVFAPLTRDRLLAMRQETLATGALIELELACACRPRSFAYLDRYIVVDIMDPPESAGPAARVEPDKPGPARSVDRDSGGNIFETARTQLDWLSPDVTPVLEAGPIPGLAAPAGGDAPVNDVESVRTALVEQLMRAAEQGLIEIDGELPPAAIAEKPGSYPNQPAATLPEPAAAETAGGLPAVPVDAPAGPDVAGEAALADSSAEAYEPGDLDPLTGDRQISVVTVFDRDDPPDINLSLSGQACPLDTEFAVSQWVGDTSAFDQIATARRKLLGEFDLVDQNAVVTLARLYVGLGFGREALAILSAYGPLAEDVQMLADLARVVDRLPPVPGGSLDQTQGCDGHAAIWRGVGFGIGNLPDDAGREAMFDAFASLPVNQRRLLGPRLTEAFLAAGDVAAATRISDLLARAPGDHGPEQVLASARLGMTVGNAPSDKEALERLAAKGGATGPEALVLLVDSLVSSGTKVPKTLLTDLELAYFQNRDGPVGALLLRSRVGALIAGNRADLALDLLAATAQTPDVIAADISRMTARALLAYMPDPGRPGAYVSKVQQHLSRLSTSIDTDQVRKLVARHHMALGLPAVARVVLAPALRRGDHDAHLVAAEAYLDEGNPAGALETLAGFAGPDALALAARAKAATGDPAGAVQVLDGSEEAKSMRQDYAWQAGEWALAARGGDVARTQLAEYMLSRPSYAAVRRLDLGDVTFASRQQDATLALAAAALSKSADARALVRRATQATADLPSN